MRKNNRKNGKKSFYELMEKYDFIISTIGAVVFGVLFGLFFIGACNGWF